MNTILISILSVGGLAAIFAVFLSVAHQKLKVEEDPRVEKIIGQLPGVNCGACGFASCRAMAEEVVGGNISVGTCSAGGNDTVQKIAEILERRLPLLPQLPGKLNMPQMYGVFTNHMENAPPDSMRTYTSTEAYGSAFS